jgi:Xaa-Pro aminopeptidase
MRAAERATSAGFASVAPWLEPGRTEREVQIELETEFFRRGGNFRPFDTIVAAARTRRLHFPPTARALGDGELVLIDGGAEVRGYASDITRTYPALGHFTPQQEELYAIVRQSPTDCCRAGVESRGVHRAASAVIAEGLVAFGLVSGESPRGSWRPGAVHAFFPHGATHGRPSRTTAGRCRNPIGEQRYRRR